MIGPNEYIEFCAHSITVSADLVPVGADMEMLHEILPAGDTDYWHVSVDREGNEHRNRLQLRRDVLGGGATTPAHGASGRLR